MSFVIPKVIILDDKPSMMKAFPERKNILVPVCGGWLVGEGSNANEVDVMENYAAATQSSTYTNIEMENNNVSDVYM